MAARFSGLCFVVNFTLNRSKLVSLTKATLITPKWLISKMAAISAMAAILKSAQIIFLTFPTNSMENSDLIRAFKVVNSSSGHGDMPPWFFQSFCLVARLVTRNDVNIGTQTIFSSKIIFRLKNNMVYQKIIIGAYKIASTQQNSNGGIFFVLSHV